MTPTISELHSWGTHELNKNNVPNPANEADKLLRYAINETRHPLTLNNTFPVSSRNIQKFKKLIKRRCQHEPYAYIAGKVTFHGHDIKVTKNVLIPRPETEILVNLVIEHLRTSKGMNNLKIADIGTGSGAIAIALAKRLPTIRLIASDKYTKALQIAKENIKLHKLNYRIKLIKGDLLAPFPNNSLDLIVANLPYLSTNSINEIAKTVKDFEPSNALFSGPQGVNAILRLIKQLKKKAKPKATIFLEIEPKQYNIIENLTNNLFPNSEIKTHPDITGVIRFISIRL
ncbi:MAG: peptide chain release factor N(5)-glutamine methyltransferase [bacterium]|nr:peptide chain release factor N(5)-glutamine methyltransferase [bacterium]